MVSCLMVHPGMEHTYKKFLLLLPVASSKGKLIEFAVVVRLSVVVK